MTKTVQSIKSSIVRRRFRRALAPCTVIVMAAILTSLARAEVPVHSHGEPLSRDRHLRGRQVKVMIVSMFGPEGQVWLDKLGPWQAVKIPGLSPDYPDIHCNVQDVCVMTTGMGHANAAASMMAVTFFSTFDLRRTYFVIAGVAGIDPMQGTLGSAAWAKYLVDFGIQWEIDAREKPDGWPSGFLGINTKSSEEKPILEYRTEVFALNPELVDTAFTLSRNVDLADSAQAQATRARFGEAPANRAPTVLQCDTLSSDIWWSGKYIGERARSWTRQLTDGHGTYCTTQQEDNATYEALKRAASTGRVDLKRVAALRTGSDFDRPRDGQSASDNLITSGSQGGYEPAIENLYRAGNPLVRDIATHWDRWRNGVPLR